MRNHFSALGDVLNVPGPTGGAESGDVEVLRSGGSGMIGVWVNDVDEGVDGACRVKGVVDLPAEDDTAWDVGDELYWDGDELTTTSTDNDRAGTAAAAKGQTDDRGKVHLNFGN